MKRYILFQYHDVGIKVNKQAVFTIKLETAQRDMFMAVAEAEHRPASQIVRKLMSQYSERQKYHHFLQEKINAAPKSVAERKSIDREDAEAFFAAHRAKVQGDW